MRTKALIEKFRTPDKAYAKPPRSQFKSRWYIIRTNDKGRYIILRGFRVYEHDWLYPEKENTQ